MNFSTVKTFKRTILTSVCNVGTFKKYKVLIMKSNREHYYIFQSSVCPKTQIRKKIFPFVFATILNILQKSSDVWLTFHQVFQANINRHSVNLRTRPSHNLLPRFIARVFIIWLPWLVVVLKCITFGEMLL